MARVIWTGPALDDLEAASDYIARDSPRQASLLVQRAFQETDRLEAFPHSGRRVPEVGRDDVRELIVGVYRIVYVLDGDSVFIVMVHHSARPLAVDQVLDRLDP